MRAAWLPCQSSEPSTCEARIASVSVSLEAVSQDLTDAGRRWWEERVDGDLVSVAVFYFFGHNTAVDDWKGLGKMAKQELDHVQIKEPYPISFSPRAPCLPFHPIISNNCLRRATVLRPDARVEMECMLPDLISNTKSFLSYVRGCIAHLCTYNYEFLCISH